MKKFRQNTFKILIISFFTIFIVIPLIKLITNINDTDVLEILGSPNFIRALKISLQTSILSTIISVFISYVIALSMIRSNIKFKGLFKLVLIIPLLIPTVTHGLGAIVLLGENGLLTKILKTSGSIRGFWGIIIGSVTFSLPTGILLISNMLKKEDASLYNQANNKGISKWKQFKAITLPYVKKPMIAVVFTIYAMIATDFGVALMVGGDDIRLPVLMYYAILEHMKFNKGVVIGAVLLIPTTISFVINLIIGNKEKNKFNKGFKIEPFEIEDNKIRDGFYYLINFIIMLYIVLAVASFAILSIAPNFPNDMTITLKNIVDIFRTDARRYLPNSLLIASCTSVFGVIIACMVASVTANNKSAFAKTLHLFASLSKAIPGIVLGLLYVFAFNKSRIFGTFWLLTLVNIVLFFGTPYLMIYDKLESDELISVIGKFKSEKVTLLEMISHFFVNTMITTSAVAFVTTADKKPISLLINPFEKNMMIESAAFISMIILLTNVIFKVLIYILKQRLKESSN